MVTEEDMNIAIQITNKIRELLGNKLTKIILFGSRARGEANTDSDFDFVILAEFAEPSWIVRNSTIRKHVKAADLYNISVDYVPITEWEFENKFFLKNHVKREGIILYESHNR